MIVILRLLYVRMHQQGKFKCGALNKANQASDTQEMKMVGILSHGDAK
jgi:hypothetical protein